MAPPLPAAHERLLSGYTAVLRRASGLPPFVPRRYGQPKREGYGVLASEKLEMLSAPFFALAAPRFMIRIWVEHHIRRVTAELGRRHVQHAADLAGDDARETFRRSGEDLLAFASTLRGWASVRGVVSAVAIPAGGLIVAGLGSENAYDAVIDAYEKGALLFALLTAALLGFYVVPFAIVPFRWKRALLRGRESAASSAEQVAPDLYELEQAAFDSVQFRRPREVPADSVAGATLLTLLLLSYAGTGVDWWLCVAFGVFAVVVLVAGFRRTPR